MTYWSLHFYRSHTHIYVLKFHGSISTTTIEGNMNNEWSHNLMRVTHIVLDCHFHHEQQWQAAMTTTHWLHQLKYIIIHPKFWANHYIESGSSVSVTFLGEWDDAVIMSVTNQGTVLMKRSTEQRNVLHLCCSALPSAYQPKFQFDHQQKITFVWGWSESRKLSSDKHSPEANVTYHM